VRRLAAQRLSYLFLITLAVVMPPTLTLQEGFKIIALGTLPAEGCRA